MYIQEDGKYFPKIFIPLLIIHNCSIVYIIIHNGRSESHCEKYGTQSNHVKYCRS